MDDAISVTVVATSFDTPEEEQMKQRGRFVQPAAPAPQAPPPPQYPAAGYPPDPYQPPAPATRKPRFWGRF